MTAYHHILAGPLPGSLRPEIIVAVGQIGPSDRLDQLIALARRRVRVDGWGRVIDPRRDATHRVHGDPVELLHRIDQAGVDPEWAHGWSLLDQTVRESLKREIDTREGATGAGIAHALSSLDWDRLVVGSSLPIREVDAHLTRGGPVVANRGASGIDGLVSTALGAASLGTGTVALLGDLSLLHDANGFLIDRPRDLTVVVVNNGGGGLFDGLPQARHSPEYERLFLTPQFRDLGALSAFHHLSHVRVSDITGVTHAVSTAIGGGGLGVVEVGVDRDYDLATRRRLDEVARGTVTSFHP
jgi:2-succinyl-5-enolpyruvyl-6-hydroxy-3-cyclohexene-1-carboxylate synthase